MIFFSSCVSIVKWPNWILLLLAPLLVRGCWTGLKCQCSGSARSCWCSQSTATKRKQTRSKSHFTLPAPSPERNRDPLLLNAQVPRPLRSGGRFTLARIDPVFAGKTAGLPPTGSSLARRFSFLQFLHPPFHFHSLGRRRAKEKKTELARYYVGHCVGRSHSDEFRQALGPVPPACQHFPPPAS